MTYVESQRVPDCQGLLRFSSFIVGAFCFMGLAGFYIFFVATKKYVTQVASVRWNGVILLAKNNLIAIEWVMETSNIRRES